ncbi:MFS transporter, partial [Chloroflexota bacterium]
MLTHFAHHLMTALPVLLLPFIRGSFALDYTQAGIVTSAFRLSSGISQLPCGWLADRIGARILVTVGIAGVGVAALLVGLSQTYVMLIVFLVLMGLLSGGYHPASPPLIAASVEAEKRGRALGIHMIGGSGSLFLAPLVAAAIAANWGWRSSFIALSIPTIIFGIMFYVLMGRIRPTKKAERKVTSSAIEIPSQGRWRRLIILIILSTLSIATVHSLVPFIPLFLVDHFGISKGTAAASIALIFSGGFWVAPLSGYLSDRWGRLPLLVAACFFSGPVIYLFTLAPYGLGIGAVLVAVGIILYVIAPVSQAYIVDEAPENRRSLIMGIYFFGAAESSGILAPVLGYLIDHVGFHSTFTITSIALVVVTLLCSMW